MHFRGGGIAHTTHFNISKANRVSQDLLGINTYDPNDTTERRLDIELLQDPDEELVERAAATTRIVLAESDCESNAGDIELDEDPLPDDGYDY